MSSVSQSQMENAQEKARAMMNYKVRISPNREMNIQSSSRGARHLKSFITEEDGKTSSTRLYSNKMKVSAYQMVVFTIGVLFTCCVLEYLVLPEYFRRTHRLEVMELRLKQPKTVRFD
ncbi:hypothetical protein XU18_2020 [Perkinsela sp. CCAP 1560/4]|nr:hypothetical protein XU18_2020 [Perkinsela sp. CCAP 1560/4]|eukprot:KNH07488.1 hypothetical protein XU18_2020 [Perkinsela sp. CCAP 1560/4]